MMTRACEDPQWLKKFLEQSQTNEIGSFVLSYNVWDDHLVAGAFFRIYEVFSRKPPTSRAALLCFFNFETGLRFADEAETDTILTSMKELFIRLISPSARTADIADREFQEALGAFEELKRNPARVLGWLGRVLRIGWESPLIQEQQRIRDLLLKDAGELLGVETTIEDIPAEDRAKLFAELRGLHANDPFSAVVIESAKLLTPSTTGSGQSSPMDDRTALDYFTWWAQDKTIRSRRNLIVYLTEALSDIPSELRKAGRGFYHIRVDTPTHAEMAAGIALMRGEYPAKIGDIPDERLAFLAKGLEFTVVRRILADAHATRETLSAELVLDQKSKNIVEQTGGLLRLIRHTGHTYDMLGGLEYVVEDLKRTVAAIKAGRWDLVRRGKLDMGRRGTGKSETVKVVAAQSGITCAEFGAVREMWVGQSERNLELSLQKIRDNAPIFVIQDEIDSFLQRRTAIGDNTGVNQRLMGMMLDFLGDETVQGVVWFGLTNMPQMLDPALIRSLRFDDKWLFTVPDSKKRPAVIRAILKQLENEIPQRGGGPFEYELSDADIEEIAAKMDYQIVEGEVVPGPPKGKVQTRLITLNGAEIKKIIDNARVRAFTRGDTVLRKEHIVEEVENTIPEYTPEDQEMEEIALGYVNHLDHVPEELRREVRKRKAQQIEGGSRRSEFPGSGGLLSS